MTAPPALLLLRQIWTAALAQNRLAFIVQPRGHMIFLFHPAMKNGSTDHHSNTAKAMALEVDLRQLLAKLQARVTYVDKQATLTRENRSLFADVVGGVRPAPFGRVPASAPAPPPAFLK